ncbi:head-tail adaptor protein [Glaciecola sp. 2405UD65-10]|uniref:head-tail adaptor protein n=1 Tax=Glaciecola sp. 2405UD65-10 TaxID=3397244 RepID=UPI003B5CBA33
MILSGRLKKHLLFSEVIKTRNEYNETIETLSSILSTRGEPVSSEVSKGITSDGSDHQKVSVFRIRYNRRVKEGLIITVDGQNFEITSIDATDPTQREMLIDAVNYIQD